MSILHSMISYIKRAKRILITQSTTIIDRILMLIRKLCVVNISVFQQISSLLRILIEDSLDFTDSILNIFKKQIMQTISFIDYILIKIIITKIDLISVYQKVIGILRGSITDFFSFADEILCKFTFHVAQTATIIDYILKQIKITKIDLVSVYQKFANIIRNNIADFFDFIDKISCKLTFYITQTTTIIDLLLRAIQISKYDLISVYQEVINTIRKSIDDLLSFIDEIAYNFASLILMEVILCDKILRRIVSVKKDIIITDQLISTKLIGITNRYLTSAEWTQNGLLAFKLITTAEGALTTIAKSVAGDVTAYWSSDVIIRHSDSSETNIDSKIAQVSRSVDGGPSNQTADWTCPETSLVSTDCLLIRTYTKLGAGSWLLNDEWITEQLDYSTLENNTWTFSYYTRRSYIGGNTWARFYHGADASYNIKITNIKYSL